MQVRQISNANIYLSSNRPDNAQRQNQSKNETSFTGLRDFTGSGLVYPGLGVLLFVILGPTLAGIYANKRAENKYINKLTELSISQVEIDAMKNRVKAGAAEWPALIDSVNTQRMIDKALILKK